MDSPEPSQDNTVAREQIMARNAQYCHVEPIPLSEDSGSDKSLDVMSTPHRPCKQMMDKKVTHVYIRKGDSCDAPFHSDPLVDATDLPQNLYRETCEWNLPATAEAGSSRGLSPVEPRLSVTTCNVDNGTKSVIMNTSACSNSSSVMLVKDPIETEMLSSLQGTKDTVNKLASRVSELTYALKTQFIPMQSLVMRSGKGFTEGCNFNYKNVQNCVDGSAGSLQENLPSENTMALKIIANIVDSQHKQKEITVTSSTELETSAGGSKNMVMKNMQAALKTSNIRSVIWPHTLVNEDLNEFVSADNIFISKFLIGFCKLLTLKPEETKSRLSLLHATALVYEGLSSWSEARDFHNAILVNIEKGLINWTTDFVSLSNNFLLKKLGEIKQGNKAHGTGKGKIVCSFDKLMDKKQGGPRKINAEIKNQGHLCQTPSIKRQQYNDDFFVENEYSEITPPNEEETSLDNCYPEIFTCDICSIGFSLKDDLIIHMQIHTDKQESITSVPHNESNSEKVKKSPINISVETKTKIAKDCINLGVTKSKQKWFHSRGLTISNATLYKWRTKYLKQSQVGGNLIQIHTCPICLLGFSQKNDVTIHMKTHTGEQGTIISLPQNYTNSGKVVKTQINISADIRNKIAKDCIMLGHTKAKLKWSQLLGHSIPESNIGNWKREYLKQSREQGRMILVPKNKTKFRRVRKGRPRVYNKKINNEIRTEIAKDCMKLGNAQARLKWSKQLGYSIPVSSIHFCKVNYLKQSQKDKLVDNKQCHTGKVQVIEHKSQNDEIIVATDDSRDIVAYTLEKDHRPKPHPVLPCDANEPITYTLVPNGSQQGKDSLIDSLGFKYVRKCDKKLPHLVTWVCSVRRKHLVCNGRVLPRKGMYLRKGIHTCKASFKFEVKNESGSLISLFEGKKEYNSSTYITPINKE